MEPVLWITPSGSGGPGTASGAFACSLRGRARVEVKGLEVWGADAGQPYAMSTEVAGVARAARAAGFERYHLAGFSAGGTVTLAAALALGEAVLSLVLIEPAYIGDDDWAPIEAEWRSRMRALRALPPEARTGAFRRMLMRPGESPPPSRDPPAWDRRDELLARMLDDCAGFTSAHLAGVRQPTLILVGGRSNPRWQRLAERLVDVMPRAERLVFPDLHHFAPPQRAAPDALGALLLDFWARAP